MAFGIVPLGLFLMLDSREIFEHAQIRNYFKDVTIEPIFTKN
jgi:hypothetical protein